MFDKKTVYHSDLVQAGTIEGLLIRSEPKPSKFKKPGMPNSYVEMKINGRDHQYICENSTCEQRLKGLNGHVVALTATGSREDADIAIYDAAGPASQQASTARATQPPQTHGNGGQTAAPPSDGVRAARLSLMQSINARVLATEAALVFTNELRQRYPNDEDMITEEHFQGVCSCFYIALDRKGLIDALPTRLVEAKKSEAAKPTPPPPKPKPTPPPPPQAAQDPDDDEIPF